MKKSRWYGLVSIGLAGFGTLAVAVPALLYWYKLGTPRLADTAEPWAALGEYFGGITGPLVAVLALIALAVNLYLQAIELEETRAESARQRSALNKQTFEGTLFQLLGQFREVARGVHVTDDRPAGYDGRDAFFKLVASLRKAYMPSTIYPELPVDRKTDEANVQDSYSTVYDANETELGPYFRSLFHVFNFVDESDRSPKEKARYASIARAQLSLNEALILFYNGTWGEGRDFRELIETYGILKHVPREKLLRPDHMDNRDWYAVSAFQDLEDREARSLTPTSVNAREKKT